MRSETGLETAPLLGSIQGYIEPADLFSRAQIALSEAKRLISTNDKPNAIKQAHTAATYAKQLVLLTAPQTESDALESSAPSSTSINISHEDAVQLLKEIFEVKMKAQSYSARLSWLYDKLFGRNGLLNAVPFMPGPHLPAEEHREPGQKTYFYWRDALTKTTAFFLTESITSTILYFLIRAIAYPSIGTGCRDYSGNYNDELAPYYYRLTQQANRDFSFSLQFTPEIHSANGLENHDSFQAIFYLTLLSVTSLLIFHSVYSCKPSHIKAGTVDSYNALNTWSDTFKLYALQTFAITLGNISVCTFMLRDNSNNDCRGDWHASTTVNLLKSSFMVAIILGSNILGKSITTCKEPKAPSASRLTATSPA